MTPNAAISGRRRPGDFSALAEKVTGKEVRFIALLGVNGFIDHLLCALNDCCCIKARSFKMVRELLSANENLLSDFKVQTWTKLKQSSVCYSSAVYDHVSDSSKLIQRPPDVIGNHRSNS